MLPPWCFHGVDVKLPRWVQSASVVAPWRLHGVFVCPFIASVMVVLTLTHRYSAVRVQRTGSVCLLRVPMVRPW